MNELEEKNMTINTLEKKMIQESNSLNEFEKKSATEITIYKKSKLMKKMRKLNLCKVRIKTVMMRKGKSWMNVYS